MKITAVEALPVDRYLFTKVHTDAGIVGYGESGAWGFLEASAAAIDKFGRYLVGKDPLLIEHHWQNMYRTSHFRGAAIMGALSAIDIALWDIAGKHFGVPVYQLMGGRVRDKARVYYHVIGDTREKLVRGVRDARADGFTAVGHLTPFLDEERSVPYFKTHADKMADAIDAVAAYREAAGTEVDLCIEIHRRLTPTEAITLAKGIEEFHPLFYEDPILPDNFEAMALVASNVNIPIATGERLHTIHEFQSLLRMGAVQYVRPRCLPRGRPDPRQEDRRSRRGTLRRRRAPQPPQPHQHRGLPPARRLHPKLHHPGVPEGRARVAQDRHGQGAPATGERLPHHPRRARNRH